MCCWTRFAVRDGRPCPTAEAVSDHDGSFVVPEAVCFRTVIAAYRFRSGAESGHCVAEAVRVRPGSGRSPCRTERWGPALRTGRPLQASGMPRVKVHANSTPAESHSLQLESKPLLAPFRARKGDPAPGAHHAMPGELVTPLQRPDREASGSGKAGRRCHPAVRDHPPTGYLLDHTTKATESGHRAHPWANASLRTGTDASD